MKCYYHHWKDCPLYKFLPVSGNKPSKYLAPNKTLHLNLELQHGSKQIKCMLQLQICIILGLYFCVTKDLIVL